MLKTAWNAGGRIVKNRLRCEEILRICSNVRGRIEVRENLFSPINPEEPAETATLVLDSDSLGKCIVETDVEPGSRRICAPDYDERITGGASAKERSSFTKSAQEELRQRESQEDGLLRRDPRQSASFKNCAYCHALEDYDYGKKKRPPGGAGDAAPDGKPKNNKFKFCESCMTCYCSRECQLADWPVHKNACAFICAAE